MNNVIFIYHISYYNNKKFFKHVYTLSEIKELFSNTTNVFLFSMQLILIIFNFINKQVKSNELFSLTDCTI